MTDSTNKRNAEGGEKSQGGKKDVAANAERRDSKNSKRSSAHENVGEHLVAS